MMGREEEGKEDKRGRRGEEMELMVKDEEKGKKRQTGNRKTKMMGKEDKCGYIEDKERRDKGRGNKDGRRE